MFKRIPLPFFSSKGSRIIGGFQTTNEEKRSGIDELTDNLVQDIRLEHFDDALNQILALMNVTEKEKVKRVQVLLALERKIIRCLQQGRDEEAIEELRDIIDEYKRLNLLERSQALELTLNQFLLEFNRKITETDEPSIIDEVDTTQNTLEVLEYRSKRAIRRFLQGKTDDAVQNLIEIIDGFRQLQMIDRAQALENWMHQFLEMKVDEDIKNKSLTELLNEDPELQNQLLSFRTQQIIKRFHEGNPRRAVLEYNEIVNDYKHQGRLDIVETLEIWFNLFITKNYLMPTQKQQIQAVPSAKVVAQPSSPTPTPPTPPISPKKIVPESLPINDKFKEKISKIKDLLKQFEESL
ncbi:MAG TPA: hypothetical protein VMV49_14655 [Candidatus Deferrimicrobium sp.]|nr:hypothetical protein [Candidatus Deferrimicrobium sp.]